MHANQPNKAPFLEWLSNSSCGTLTMAEQCREALRILAGQIAGFPHSVRAVIRDKRGPGRVELSSLEPTPESVMCSNVTRIAGSSYSRPLLNHVYRCWHWATLIARNENIAYDPETLYCAALLHDIGLTPSYAPNNTCACFVISSARDAADILRGWDAPNNMIEHVAEAIARHFDARIRVDTTAEVTLLHDAAFLDVVGLGVHRTTAADRNAVLDAYTRTDFAAEFAAALKHEAKQRPQSRAALSHRLGASVAIRLNPLEYHPRAHASIPTSF